VEISHEEQFILDAIKAKGGSVSYKKLQDLCANEFEGVRLILKKLKDKTLVEYDGTIPGFSAQIKLK